MTLDLGVAGTSYVVEALNLPPKVAKRFRSFGHDTRDKGGDPTD